MTKRELKNLNQAAAALAGAIRNGDVAGVDRWQHTLMALESAEARRRRRLTTRR